MLTVASPPTDLHPAENQTTQGGCAKAETWTQDRPLELWGTNTTCHNTIKRFQDVKLLIWKKILGGFLSLRWLSNLFYLTISQLNLPFSSAHLIDLNMYFFFKDCKISIQDIDFFHSVTWNTFRFHLCLCCLGKSIWFGKLIKHEKWLQLLWLFLLNNSHFFHKRVILHSIKLIERSVAAG